MLDGTKIGMDFGQFEQLFHQSPETLGMTDCDLQIIALLFAGESVGFEQECLEVTLDRGDGCTQIMGDVRQQLAAQPVGLAQRDHLRDDRRLDLAGDAEMELARDGDRLGGRDACLGRADE